MSNRDQVRPSTEFDTPYLEAYDPDYEGVPHDTPLSGKWLLWVPEPEVDKAWTIIKDATESGDLGMAAKVATAKPNPLTLYHDKRLICVFIPMANDETDKQHVYMRLVSLGYPPERYKTNEQTFTDIGRRRTREHSQ